MVPDADGRWPLMEAELIEPDFYLDHDPHAGAGFVQAVQAGLASGIEIGRASCRDSECPYVSISVVAVSLDKKDDVHTDSEQRCHSNQHYILIRQVSTTNVTQTV